MKTFAIAFPFISIICLVFCMFSELQDRQGWPGKDVPVSNAPVNLPYFTNFIDYPNTSETPHGWTEETTKRALRDMADKAISGYHIFTNYVTNAHEIHKMTASPAIRLIGPKTLPFVYCFAFDGIWYLVTEQGGIVKHRGLEPGDLLE